MKRSIYPLVFASMILGAADANAAYHLAQELKIPGDGGWDYLAFDAPSHRLFVSHGSRVEVIDTKTLTPSGAIDGTPGVHGIAIANDIGRGYVSAGAASRVVVFDLRTLAKVGEITTGENPDAILYEPTTHRVFTFNGRGRDATVVDARSNAVIGTIALDAKPEFAVFDGHGHVFVNLEDRNSVAEIDASKLTVLATWPLVGCEEPSGLAIDRKHHRLFSVCSNKVMNILDATTGRAVAQLPIGDGVDAAGFDASVQRAFASAGDGILTIIQEHGPDSFSVLETVATKSGARTMTLDEKTHRVFLSTAQRGPRPEPSAEQPRPRAPVIAGTFEVLVVEP
jgi:DNA-binding beta-propeller fold protein YncE